MDGAMPRRLPSPVPAPTCTGAARPYAPDPGGHGQPTPDRARMPFPIKRAARLAGMVLIAGGAWGRPP